MKKVIIAVLLIAAVCVTMCACAGEKVEKSDLVGGMWVCSYSYKGVANTVSIQFRDDNTYYKLELKDGVVDNSVDGNYEINGNKVKLFDNANNGVTYEYKDGVLLLDGINDKGEKVKRKFNNSEKKK